MGQIKLLVGQTHGTLFEAKKPEIADTRYFQIDATVNMGPLSKGAVLELPYINETPNEKLWYFYEMFGDGNTQIAEDKYGRHFQPIPIVDVIQAIESDIKNDDCRRLEWALSLLKSMQKESYDTLSVILWGY